MPRNKDPAVLFYTSDFLVGCSALTMEERGQYITLLCLQHTTGHLSKKAMSLAVGTVSPDVMTKFQEDEDGLYFNERMDEEIEAREKYMATKRAAGSKGGRAKAEAIANSKQNVSNANSNANSGGVSENVALENENININIDKSISKDTKAIKHKYGLYNNVLLSDEDVTKLQAEFPSDWRVRIERLSEYIASTGKTYKSHLATIRSWDRQEKEKGKPPDKPRYGNFDPEEALEAAIRRSHGEA